MINASALMENDATTAFDRMLPELANITCQQLHDTFCE
jgi:hypothetical protein